MHWKHIIGIIEDRIEDVLATTEEYGYAVIERLGNKGWLV